MWFRRANGLVPAKRRSRWIGIGIGLGEEAGGGGERGGQRRGPLDDGRQVVLGRRALALQRRVAERAQQRGRVAGGVIGAGSGS